MKFATLAALRAASEAARPVVLATRLADGAQFILPAEDAPPGLADAADRVARTSSRVADIAGERWFLHLHAPPPRLAIIGAVHIAQSLAPMAAGLGYAVTVIDPRRGFASPDRFPGTVLNLEWPDAAVESLAPDRSLSVVALSHDPKLDDPALDRALRSEAAYVGALGSRKSHASRLERLRAMGHDETALARIRGPVGLAIGGITTAEIALSIMAEIVAVRRGAALGQR